MSTCYRRSSPVSNRYTPQRHQFRAANAHQWFASPSSPYHPEYWGAHRCWSCHEVTSPVSLRCSMLRCPASSAAHQSGAVTFDVEYGDRRVSLITTGHCEQCPDWSAHIFSETSTISLQCFGSSDLRTPAIRPCLWSFDVAAMTAQPREYPIQICSAGQPSSTRQRPRLPQTVHSAVQRSRSIIIAFCIIYSCRQFVVRRSVQGRFRCLRQLFRTVCQLPLHLTTVWQSFIVVRKLFVFAIVSRRRSITVFFSIVA